MATRTNEAKVLSCRCVVTFSAAARQAVEAIGGSALLSLYPPTGTHAFDVLVNDDAARVTHFSAGGEKGWTFVRRSGTRAASAWDHTKRVAFNFEADDLVPTQVRPARGLKAEINSVGEHVVAQIHMRDPKSGEIRTVFRFSKSRELKHFGRPLLHILFGGPSCHAKSGFPLADLEKLGCVVEAQTFIGDIAVPVSKLVVEGFDVLETAKHDFRPPRGFTVQRMEPHPPPPIEPVLRVPGSTPPPSGKPSSGAMVLADRKQTLSADECLPPSCFESTRFGSMAAVVHQDALDHATTVINGIAGALSLATPAAPTATLSNGTLTIDWLTPLAAIGSTAGPGAGLSCFFRSKRKAATAMASASGGGGLLDRLAARNLIERDPNTHLSRLQSEAASGELNNSMRRWGLNTLQIAAMFAANGDLNTVPASLGIAVLEGYETTDLGTLRIPGFPKESAPFDPFNGVPLLEGCIQGKLWSLTGAMNFGSLAGGSLIPVATIGSSGNIAVTVVIPTTTLSVTSTWGLTPLGIGRFNSPLLALCLLFPAACPQAALFFALFTWILSGQLSVLTAATSGVSVSLDITYKWDPDANLVNPFVTVTATTGTITVSAPGPQSFFAELVETIVSAAGNAMNAWVPLLGLAIAQALEQALRGNGLSFPLAASQTGMSAVSGGAHSAANESLTVFAEISPDGAFSTQPYVTQVPTATAVASQLEICHAVMRGALNPQPAVPPIPGKPAIKSGNYVALALSQNALNCYVFSRWRPQKNPSYRLDISDPQAVSDLVALAPAGALAGNVTAIHAWAAVPPRVEIAEETLAALGPPLLVFFDDIRVCFEGTAPTDPKVGFERPTIPLYELKFNAKTTGTVMLGWPQMFDVLFSVAPADVSSSDDRVWEFTDINRPTIARTLPTDQWKDFATGIAIGMLQPYDKSTVKELAGPPAWPRPIPGGLAQQFYPPTPSLFSPTPDVSYVEVLGSSRALYLPTAVRTTLLELVDGSGAPDLNSLLNVMPPASVTVLSFGCGGGHNLRQGAGAPPNAPDLPKTIGFGPEYAIPSMLP